jgi:hypothetical protein
MWAWSLDLVKLTWSDLRETHTYFIGILDPIGLVTLKCQFHAPELNLKCLRAASELAAKIIARA